MKKRKEWLSVFFPLIAAAVLFFFLTAFSNVGKGSKEEGKLQLEQALKRCVVTCYATEGFYPPSIDYMKEHYGIQVDEEHYVVYYEVVAQNLMPEITVLEKRHEK